MVCIVSKKNQVGGFEERLGVPRLAKTAYDPGPFPGSPPSPHFEHLASALSSLGHRISLFQLHVELAASADGRHLECPEVMADTPDHLSSKSATRTRRSSSAANKQRECLTCGRIFSKTDHLERHVRSHTKEKPFGCSVCGRKYGRQ